MKRRKFWLLATSALASSLLGVSEPALAVNECGPLDASGSATCTPAGTPPNPGNPYPNGINYDPTDSPIHLTLQPGVIVTIPQGPGSVNAVNGANTGGVSSPADVSITADGVTINNTANPGTSNNTGLRIQSSGDAIINATNTTINVSGTDSTWAILDFSHRNSALRSNLASVNFQGTIIATAGSEGGAIQVDNRGAGNATVVASGDIRVVPNAGPGTTQYGLLAHAGDSLFGSSGPGNASVTFNSGALDVSANRPRGILAWVDGIGSATVTTGTGTVINVSGTERGGPGVYVFSSTATAPNKLTANVASEIMSSGPDTTASGNLPAGIRALSSAGAQIDVTYTGPGITTFGGNGTGITALSSGSGSITVNSSGPINTTNGSNAVGILADSSGTILRRSPGLLTDIQPINPVPTAITGSVQVNTSKNVLAQGEFGTGISATSGSGSVTVNVQAGSVMGGWQADLTSVGPTYGLQAAGIFLNSPGGTTLINNGFIGALSDRAVAGDPQVINNGTIEGFVQFTGGDNSITNNNTFNLRHFADTNGDGVRDTLRVAIADLGDFPNNSFTNNGTLRLPAVTGATMLDRTGQYLPLGNTNNAMALGGPLQGHLIGVSTFTNSGTIDLQSNPVAGDVLVITGSRQAGVPGTGNFISNGGTLRLDTVLNQGDVATRSDTLVVDGTSLGAGGATNMIVRNAGGAGALTVNNGILVVQALDPGHSAPGVFRLGTSPLIAGPYEYTLFHGGVGTDAMNGNWYLRSTLPTPEPIPPTPGPTPPSPEIPNFRVETSLYAAIPSMALLYGRNLLDTLHDRVGEEFDEGGALAAAPGGYYKAAPLNPASQYLGWGRIIGMNGVQQGNALGVIGSGAGGGSPHFDYAFLGLQAGMDFYRQDRPDGSRDHAGAYFAIGTNQGQVTHFDGREGNSDFAAYTLGGYWTHFGPTGWYTDAILQGTFYDINSTANRGLPTFKTQGQGFAASLETGYPFKFAGGWFIEPQAQLVFQNININDANDIAAQVRFADVNSLAGRIGARFGRTWMIDDSSRTITAWIRPNLWNEFQGNPTTLFSSATGFVPFHADLGGLWGEINAGISGQVTSTTTLFANASYQSRFDGGGFAYTGKAGLRVNW